MDFRDQIPNLLYQGLILTLWLSILSAVLSLIVGTIVGVMRVSPFIPLATVAQGFVEFFRNIPLLITIFFVFNGLPIFFNRFGITQARINWELFSLDLGGYKLQFLNLDLFSFFWAGVIALVAYHSPYVAEVVRAALQAISKGQMEASRSLGFSWLGSMRHVLLPQAFRTMVPPLGSLFSALIRNTSLCSAIAVPELIYQADFIEGRTASPTIFIVAGALYLIFTIPLGLGINLLERRLSLARIRR